MILPLGIRVLDKRRGRGGYGVIVGISQSGEQVIVQWPQGNTERMARRDVWVAR